MSGVKRTKMEEEFDDLDIDDFEEENEKINPLAAAGVFLGLIIVAGLICVVLWSVTHSSDSKQNSPFIIETVEESKEEITESDAPVEAVEPEEESREEATEAKVEEGTVSEPVESEAVISELKEPETVVTTENTEVEVFDPNRFTTQDGRVVIFTDCDDYVRPKEYVNLRTEPSTSQGESTVKCQISHADIVHRTGYSADAGWSRVEFYGEILYVVSSYVYNTEAAK